MEINDFNGSTFTGFQQGEDILVDSSILLALISIHDLGTAILYSNRNYGGSYEWDSP